MGTPLTCGAVPRPSNRGEGRARFLTENGELRPTKRLARPTKAGSATGKRRLIGGEPLPGHDAKASAWYQPSRADELAAWCKRRLKVPVGHDLAGKPLVLPKFAIELPPTSSGFGWMDAYKDYGSG